MNKNATVLFLLACFSFLLPACGQETPLYKDPKAPLEARVNDLFQRMTPDEKMDLLTGTDFTTRPLPRLGVPAMEMADAGQGVRGGTSGTQGPATLFPAGVAMASTWDPALIGRVGAAIGVEALNKGTGAQVLLGPAVNIQRSPLGGRNGEYFSEDPFLAARLGVGYIQGMQSTGCVACLKHFACNNEEVDRDYVDVRVGERALREIYLPAFEAGVKEGHVWTVMSAYNKVNGFHMSANTYLLTDVLKKGWNWDGMVMSDWGGVHETARVVQAGNDLEMPGPGFLAHDKIAAALKNGQITQEAIDDNVHRILRAVLRAGLLDGARTPPDHSKVNSPAHRQLALGAAAQGIVLLKNENGLLPLDRTRLHSLAVIGPGATGMQLGAAGSAGLEPAVSVQPLDGIRQRAGAGIAVTYAAGTPAGVPVPPSALFSPTGNPGGLRAEYFANRDLLGTPALVRTDPQIRFDWGTRGPAGLPGTDFSVRWTGRLVASATGHFLLTFAGDDGFRLFLDDKPLFDHWTEGSETQQTADVDLVQGHSYALRVEYFQAAGLATARLGWTTPDVDPYSAAVQAARKADVAVVVVTTSGMEGEGQDRSSMALPHDQDALIQAVAAVNKKTVVVLNNGTPVLMTAWLQKVPALVETWFPGEEGGAALAAVLFGDVDPSGKLPLTLAARREDYPDYGHFPGTGRHVDYAEGIYVGYRHFDKAKVAPLFPFGYGLSYTTFRYGPVALSSPVLSPNKTLTASLDITNTGRRAGAEVVQLYVHDPQPRIDKPVRELKGFAKVFLTLGQTRRVSFTLTPRALSYCDVPGKQWKADAGLYDVQVGASSRDIRQQATMRLAADYTEAIPLLSEQTQTPPSLGTDLAAGRPATASSSENNASAPGGQYGPGSAVDGKDDTRWSSEFSDPQWIAVDLGKAIVIDRVRLLWESAYAAAYKIQVGTDGQTWTDVYSTQDGQGDEETIRFAPVSARFVRMYGIKRATAYGYSLFNFEVYAPGP